MKSFTTYRLIGSIQLLLVVIAGCSRETGQTPVPTQTAAPPPLNITYCDIAPADLCLEGFGQEGEDKMLILLKADDRSFADIDVRVDGPEGEIFFDCRPSEDFPENIYCLGDDFPDGENLKLNIYSKNSEKLLAMGVFIVAYSDTLESDVDFGIATSEATITSPPPISTSTPRPAYPNYPNYPNSSYSNPTSSP